MGVVGEVIEAGETLGANSGQIATVAEEASGGLMSRIKNIANVFHVGHKTGHTLNRIGDALTGEKEHHPGLISSALGNVVSMADKAELTLEIVRAAIDVMQHGFNKKTESEIAGLGTRVLVETEMGAHGLNPLATVAAGVGSEKLVEGFAEKGLEGALRQKPGSPIAGLSPDALGKVALAGAGIAGAMAMEHKRAAQPAGNELPPVSGESKSQNKDNGFDRILNAASIAAQAASMVPGLNDIVGVPVLLGIAGTKAAADLVEGKGLGKAVGDAMPTLTTAAIVAIPGVGGEANAALKLGNAALKGGIAVGGFATQHVADGSAPELVRVTRTIQSAEMGRK